MGYDLHITRKEDWWSDGEGPIITPEEWRAIVAADDELTPMPENGPYFVSWSGPGAYPCWLDYSECEGGLFSKYPTDEFIEKMVRIARLLNARVLGDEGEEYGTPFD